MVDKLPDPVDLHVGSRVRLRRVVLNMSQEKLGESLGLTFQQIQKYEKGSNRISASRLYQISRVLDVPIQFFFEDLPCESDPLNGTRFAAHKGDEANVLSFINSAEGLQLNRAFAEIQDTTVRRKIVELLRILADHDVEQQPRIPA